MSKRKDELKEIIQILWNQYEHMFTVRTRKSQNSVNFLLVVVTFLPIVNLMLFEIFRYHLFLVPIIFQIAAFLVLIKSLFPYQVMIPWTKPEEVPHLLKNDIVWEHFFGQIKAGETETYMEMKESRKIIQRALYLILFSIYALLLATLFFIFRGYLLYYLILLITGGAFVLFKYYLKPSKSLFSENTKKHIEDIRKYTEKQNQ